MRLLIASLLALSSACIGTEHCPQDDGFDGPGFAVANRGALDDGTPIGHDSAIPWGSDVSLGPDDDLHASDDAGQIPPEDILRFFDAAGQDVAVDSTTFEHPDYHDGGGCAFSERVYYAGRLSPGTYTLVHFRDPSVGDPVNCLSDACPWTDREGDTALVSTLVVSDAPVIPATTR